MKTRVHSTTAILTGVCIILGFGFFVNPLGSSPIAAATQKEAAMSQHATGTFEVKLTPQPLADESEAKDKNLGRMSLDKTFHGDLEGTSKGEMLTAATSVKGSAAYVAIERVSGTLRGRTGTFTLQHSGTMNRGGLQQSVTVVPDSGTDQLTGLTGKMTINIVDGKHHYDFEYALPEKQ